MLVSPLAHISQKQPFDCETRSHIEKSASPEEACGVGFMSSPTKGLHIPTGDIEVFVNIYDVTHDGTIQTINGLFANSFAPLKLGGLFHVGIEILSTEWAYGWSQAGTGVTCGAPRSESQHRFRERVSLSKTKLSEGEIEKLLRALVLEYRGKDYHIIERNCCHFAEDLSKRLGVDAIPAWVHRMGQLCDSLRKASKSLSDLNGFHLSCTSHGPGQSIPRRGSESRSQSRSRRRSQSRSCSEDASRSASKHLLRV